MHRVDSATPRDQPNAFCPLRLDGDLHFEWESPAYRTVVRAWGDEVLALEPKATHFLYAVDGASTLRTHHSRFPLVAGMYAAMVDGNVQGSRQQETDLAVGRGLVVSHFGVTGLFTVGGPIEARGRLRYIDGCTDSLLIAPQLRGEPCLNHLHIPPNTKQTRHTHPSLRVGIIARGRGRCVTPRSEHWLEPGLAFAIVPDAPHSFFTGEDSLDVVVYHPDSDTGPSHEDHPMINRTILASR